MEPVLTPDACFARYRATGDPAAFGALFDVTGPELLKVAIALCGDASAAEDVVQETFLAALQDLDQFDAGRPVMPWLVGILKHRAARSRRGVARRPDPVRLQATGSHAESDPSLPASLPASLAEGTRGPELLAALEGLPEPYRAVALLRWRYGLAPAEIAHVRAESAGTTRSLLTRALQRLRQSVLWLPLALFGVRLPRGLAAVRGRVVTAAGSGGVLTASVAGGTLVAKQWIAVAGLALLAAGAGAWWYASARPRGSSSSPAGADLAAEAPLVLAGKGRERSAAPAPVETTPSSVLDKFVRGRVLSSADRPVPGALLHVRPWYGKHAPPVFETKAAPDGTFRFAYDDAWDGGDLTASAPGCTSERVFLTGGAEVVVRLWAGAALEGVVRDAVTLEPVADAEIAAHQPGAPWGELGAWFDVRGHGDTDGRYRLAGLPPGRIALTVSCAEHMTGDFVLEVAAGSVTRRDLFVNTGGRIAGRVTLDGRPVAEVEVRGWWSGGTDAHARRARTDGEGRYALAGLRDGEWQISVHDPVHGDGSCESAVVAARRSAVRDIALHGTVPVRGRVLLDGHPVAGALVGTALRDLGAHSVTTDAEGRFETAEGRTHQQLRLTAHLPGVGFEVLDVPLPSGDVPPIDVPLQRFARLRGRFRSPGREPPADPRIQVQVQHPEFAHLLARPDGSFEALVPPGAIGLDATAPGWPAAERVEVDVPEGGTRDGIEIVFDAGADLVGTLVDAEGRPLARAKVQVANVSGRGGDLTTWLTDDDGRFAFRALPVDEAVLYVTSMGRPLVEIKGVRVPQSDARVALPAEPEPLRGRVLQADGTPCRQGRVCVRLLTDEKGQPRARPVDLVPMPFNDAEGRFEGLPMAGFWLAPTPWRVRVCATDEAGVSAWTEVDSTTRHELTLRLAPAARLSGRIRNARGEPVVGAWLTHTGLAREYLLRSESEGRYLLAPLAAGSHTLRVWREGYCTVDRPHACESGADDTLDVTLPLGGTVVVRVRDAAALPVAGAEVRFRDAADQVIPLDSYRNSINWQPRAPVSRERQTTTDAEGVVQRLFLPPGALTVEVECAGYETLRLPVTLPDEATVELPAVLTKLGAAR